MIDKNKIPTGYKYMIESKSSDSCKHDFKKSGLGQFEKDGKMVKVMVMECPECDSVIESDIIYVH